MVFLFSKFSYIFVNIIFVDVHRSSKHMSFTYHYMMVMMVMSIASIRHCGCHKISRYLASPIEKKATYLWNIWRNHCPGIMFVNKASMYSWLPTSVRLMLVDLQMKWWLSLYPVNLWGRPWVQEYILQLLTNRGKYCYQGNIRLKLGISYWMSSVHHNISCNCKSVALWCRRHYNMD